MVLVTYSLDLSASGSEIFAFDKLSFLRLDASISLLECFVILQQQPNLIAYDRGVFTVVIGYRNAGNPRSLVEPLRGMEVGALDG